MKIESCGICGGQNFQQLWELPKLPLTERFGPYSPEKDLAFDQQLIICSECGHVQLGIQLSPDILYTAKEYSFRTATSASARSGVVFFLHFLQKVAPGKTFKSLADVGGNDLYVARQLENIVEQRSVIDPICAEDDGKKIDGIQVFGRLIENINLSKNLIPPDLVVCRHTLEHISNPRKVLLQLFKECHPDCLYVFEIPCFENLIESLRFDAIFHQHYHYYDLVAFRRLLWETGGEYLAHDYNYQGSCGGAMVIAFRKAKVPQIKPSTDISQRISFIKGRLRSFLSYVEMQEACLNDLPTPLFGYGASLMLATLAYHLKLDFSRVKCILDDDRAKDGWTYENLPVVVRHPEIEKPAPNSFYLITSLENARPLTRRIQEFKPRRIFTPAIL